MDSLPAKSDKALHKEATQARKRRSKPANLQDQVVSMDKWSEMQKETFPTPVASIHKGGSENVMRQTGQDRRDSRLDYRVEIGQDGKRVGGKLNPDWVEWLMGWPIGWSDSKPLGMDKFQKWQEQHSRY